jgi:Ca2+-binding EF-hand superfamily protein
MFIAGMVCTMVVFAEEIPNSFKKKDLNKDMQITEEEWVASSRSMAENKGAVFNERKTREYMKEFDVNNDGVVTLEEFTKSSRLKG